MARAQARLTKRQLAKLLALAHREKVHLVPYDPRWPELCRREKEHLLSCLPRELIKRVEHFGSTAIPGLSAKPVVDMLVEVTDLKETKRRVIPILEAQGYDYFWRPIRGGDAPPFYAWFIKRNANGERTHHIHMVESHSENWEALLFRDYLIAHPSVARQYEQVKRRLVRNHNGDRVAYADGKGEFVDRVTQRAKRFYEKI